MSHSVDMDNKEPCGKVGEVESEVAGEQHLDPDFRVFF